MKRIKQIIESLKVISDKPSKTIADMADRVLSDAGGMDAEVEANASAEDLRLVKNILLAVVRLAEDMEKPVAEAKS